MAKKWKKQTEEEESANVENDAAEGLQLFFFLIAIRL